MCARGACAPLLCGPSTSPLGDSLDPHSEARWLLGLSSADRARFLATLAHNLTITGRARPAEQLRDLNEIQHQILGYLCYTLGPEEDPAFLPLVARDVLEPRNQSLREALRGDWRDAREWYDAVP